MFFNQDHLRITKVRTVDGVTPVYDDQRRPELKIVFAPDTRETRKLFDELNSRLPTHLKMKIEKVKGYTPQQIQSQPPVDVSALEKEIAELKALNASLIEKQEKASEGSDNVDEEVKEPTKASKSVKEKAK